MPCLAVIFTTALVIIVVGVVLGFALDYWVNRDRY
jgi:hypothetical protein